MVVVIPMAGRGSRYADHGYEIPKPLIDVAGRPMIVWALKSVLSLPSCRYVFIVLREHEKRYQIGNLLSRYVACPFDLVELDQVTQGQLCTVLEAKHLLDPDEEVLIASSDTLVEGDIYRDIKESPFDGIISVANLPGDQWSFARTDEYGRVVEVTEKVRISDNASTGLYYFRRAKDLVSFGEAMVINQQLTRGEYYVIPVYQKMIKAGKIVGISKAESMWDMGTPAAKTAFENHLSRMS